MFILKKGHQPGVYVPLRALFLVIPVLQVPRIYIQVIVWGDHPVIFLFCLFGLMLYIHVVNS